MYRLLQYYGKYQSLRGGLGGLPGWARLLLFVAALPGIVLIALSILAFVVSVFVLLLLTVPVYRLLQVLTGTGRGEDFDGAEGLPESEFTPAPHPPVDVTASVVSDEAVLDEAAAGEGAGGGSSPAAGDQPLPRPRRQVDVKIIE